MSSVPCNNSIRFLYWSFSLIDVDTLPAREVDCLLPLQGGPQFKAMLMATPQMRSEFGLPFRSKRSAVWPADPRGRRGCREPAGKTCYLPRFHRMLAPHPFPHSFQNDSEYFVQSPKLSQADYLDAGNTWTSSSVEARSGVRPVFVIRSCKTSSPTLVPLSPT